MLVIGGGVAGLAAAARLAESGRRLTLLEARKRLGGRVHTVRDPAVSVPIELGAEFVHGQAHALRALIESAGLSLFEVAERHQQSAGRSRKPLPAVNALVADLLGPAPLSQVDRPVSRLLAERRAAGSDPARLEAAVRYIQGFHGADLERLGVHALAEAELGGGAGDPQSRLAGGYAGLVRALAVRLASASVRTGLAVTALRWREGAVRVTARSAVGIEELEAAAAIITLPLGVLQASPDAQGGVAIDPLPTGWRAALSAWHMGAAERVVLRFDTAWWADGRADPPAFLHGVGAAFPVWWTPLPTRAPIVTGWCGGPDAVRLGDLDEAELAAHALRSAARVFGREVEWLAERLRGVYHHCWSRDPFSRGAYSYGGVGAGEARSVLARPVAGTLVLAGEALATDGRNGTVDGALVSGREAAEQVLGQN